MGWDQERVIRRPPFEIIIDLNDVTNERRVGVYYGDALMAMEFVQPIENVVDRLVSAATHQLRPVV